MKVVFINHSDSRGGASVVTFRLMQALVSAGVDARMVVTSKTTDSPRVAQIGPHWRVKASFLAEHAEIFVRDGFDRANVFKISTARYGLPLSDHPWVREADVVALNWINQGMLSLKGIRDIAALGKPIVWTMHDQWNMTGVCHYTAGCERWKNTCRNCPLIARGKRSTDLSTSVQKAKRRLYSEVPIHFVAVSNRLGELARASSLMTDARLSVIPNAFPIDEFSPIPSIPRSELGLPDGKRLVVMGAARLDDPVKDYPTAIESLNLVETPDVHAVFFGDLRDQMLLEKLKKEHTWLGPIDGDRVKALMSHADIVLSTSVWETLPGTIVEGISSGAAAVATSNGGQSDIVTDGVTGYLATSADPAEIARLIDRALTLDFSPEGRQARHAEMARRFAADAVAARYLALFNQLTPR